MRTITITRTIYTVEELRTQCPAAFQAAVDRHAQLTYELADNSDEWGSLIALDERANFMRDGHWGWFGDSDLDSLTGRRALAWLENVVLGPLRLPWSPITDPERRKRAHYGQRPGTLPDCPLTGFYTDEVLLDALRESLASGVRLRDALTSLYTVTVRLIEDDLAARATEEGFIEDAIGNEVEFYEDGSTV